MKPIKKLNGKTVAIVGLGKSWFDYNLAKSHSVHFDEVGQSMLLLRSYFMTAFL